MNRTERHSAVSRRRLLGGVSAAALGSLAGCLSDARSILGRSSSSQVSLTIASLIADDDPASAQIARHLRSHLESVGISADIDYYGSETFRLAVLVNQSFDLAVFRHPGGWDPDFLYGMFHSSYGPERGWQNPSGLSDLDVDELLETQRTTSVPEREAAVSQLLDRLATQQPVAPLCVPEAYRLVRADRIEGYEGRQFDRASDVLALEVTTDRDELTLVIDESAPTANLNPLSVEARGSDTVTGLLYDSLVIVEDEEYLPWLASSVQWDGERVELTLRDVAWHDGVPVTADDVAFTYRLLADTSLDELETTSPTARFRSRSDIVTDISVQGTHTLTFSVDGTETTAHRALTVPILPEHEWSDRTGSAEFAGLSGDEMTTEAVITDNIPPIGSGPYRFVDRSERSELVLERYDDHFSRVADDLSAFRPPARRIVCTVAPSDAAAHAGIRDGDVDLTLTPVWHSTATSAREDDEGTVITSSPTGFYQIMYDTRDRPLSNPRFRRLVSRLVDKVWLVDHIFDGNARPIAVPMADSEWVPSSLTIGSDTTDPEVPFLGSEGALDADDARAQLVEMGYQYNEAGELVTSGGS